MPKRKEINEEDELSEKLNLTDSKAKCCRRIEQEVKISIEEAIQKFKEILKNAQTIGEYSVSGEATELPIIPNIHVNNFGPISFPLNDSQANDLFKVVHFFVFILKIIIL